MTQSLADPTVSEARERIIEVADRLFALKGLGVVTLREIAEEVGIRHASLYYHFPKGKESIYVEVTERSIKRHGAGLKAAIEAGGPSLRERLHRASDWLLSQPPMDLIRMIHSDMPALAPVDARRLTDLVYVLILRQVEGTISAARAAGEIGGPNPGLIAGGIVGLVESFHSMPDFAVGTSRAELARDLIDVFLSGLGYQGPGLSASPYKIYESKAPEGA